MSDILKPGLTGTAVTTVTNANTAAAMKSGSLNVFATPAMCALMEEAACAAVNAHLAAGCGTVGTKLDITHERATALGCAVTATAVLTAAEGRKLIFKVEARDGKGLIGQGIHERFVIDNAKFMAKLGR